MCEGERGEGANHEPAQCAATVRSLDHYDPLDIVHLRGFSAVFSGYSLYETLPLVGVSTFNMVSDANFDAALWCRMSRWLGA
jgi:hypothetical protein